MKKRNVMPWKVIILIVILAVVAFVLFPKRLSSRINLDNLAKDDLIIEVIHRNSILEGDTVTSTTDVTKIKELENFLDQYKSMPSLIKTKLLEKLDDEESYTINFKNNEGFLTTIVLYNKNFEVYNKFKLISSIDTLDVYNVIGENIDFNFLEQFVKSMN